MRIALRELRRRTRRFVPTTVALTLIVRVRDSTLMMPPPPPPPQSSQPPP